jgi:hypothetical protein
MRAKIWLDEQRSRMLVARNDQVINGNRLWYILDIRQILGGDEECFSEHIVNNFFQVYLNATFLIIHFH